MTVVTKRVLYPLIYVAYAGITGGLSAFFCHTFVGVDKYVAFIIAGAAGYAAAVFFDWMADCRRQYRERDSESP